VKPLVIDYDDPEYPDAPYPKGERIGTLDYEAFVAMRRPDFAWAMPDDEWDAISLNYTSGTTGNPKGVVYHHRGAALMAYTNTHPRRHGQACVYLWTLPMFHCNGWCFPWTLSVQAARMSACAGCAPRRCTTRSPNMASRICAARRS
jgi:fatty-acyl-CoA synthase